MIIAEFFRKNGEITGFKVSGHAGYDESGRDIVCASVSSAVMMAANLITEIFGFEAEISAVDDTVTLKTDVPEDSVLQGLYKGLILQTEQISLEFNGTIKLKYSEV